MTTVEQYIAAFPQNIQELLHQVKDTIVETAPNALETISYSMPAYKVNGKPLVYFAGYKSHIGFYATPTGHEAFADELSIYKQGKGSVQFPVDEPLPVELIKRIVTFRLKENEIKNNKDKKVKEELLFGSLSLPAQRALAEHNITTIVELSGFTEKEITGLYGVGKNSIPKLTALLKEHGLRFKN
jgi:uncharacterized protein YdhG (YjbR/CyaY superfamily)